MVFPVDVVRHRGARRYVIRVTADGRLRLTVPRGATIDDGLRFAASESRWIEREWHRQQRARASWTVGTPVWYRGEQIALVADGQSLTVGPERIGLESRT